MEWIHYLSGPIIGAIIGYFTNYIAVKMLFRPHHEIRIWGMKLPFTPGLIPKRQKDLASAVGKAVSKSLLTEEDMSNMLLSDNVENSVVDLCLTQLKKTAKSTKRVETAVSDITGEEIYQKTRSNLKSAVTDRIMNAITEVNVAGIIAEEGKQVINEMIGGTMFAMFLSEDTINSLADNVGTYAERYIQENGPQMVEAQLEKEITLYEEKRLYQLGEPLLKYEAVAEEKIREIYRACIGNVAGKIVREFHIDRVIEDKINAMAVQELEDLVMSVMKHELGMIVNLGALIGLLLGIVNVFL